MQLCSLKTHDYELMKHLEESERLEEMTTYIDRQMYFYYHPQRSNMTYENKSETFSHYMCGIEQ